MQWQHRVTAVATIPVPSSQQATFVSEQVLTSRAPSSSPIDPGCIDPVARSGSASWISVDGVAVIPGCSHPSGMRAARLYRGLIGLLEYGPLVLVAVTKWLSRRGAEPDGDTGSP